MKVFNFKSLALLFVGGLIAVMLNIASCGGGEEAAQAVNNPPVAVNDALNAVQSSMTNLNLVVNDSDADDGLDLASIEIVFAPAHASGPVVVKSDGTVDYTHDGTATTSDTFTYTIKDKSGAVSNIATVTLKISAVPVNNPPVAVNDILSADHGTTTNLGLADNDYDTDDGLDLASIAIETDPSRGTIVNNFNGTVDYIHNGTAATSDTFTYTIKDITGAVSNTATVTLTIVTNNPPVADAGADQAVVPGQTVILDGGNSSDPDGDVLTYYWDLQSRPAESSSLFTSTSENPSFTPDFYGSYTVRLVVNDGTVDSPADTVVVTATTAGQRKYDAACASCHKAGRYDRIGSDSDLYDDGEKLRTDLDFYKQMKNVPDITPQEVIDLNAFLEDPLIAP